MSAIKEFIRLNAKLLLHIMITLFLSFLFAWFFKQFPDYRWSVNLILALLSVYCVYRMIFKKQLVDSFLKILCILALLTAVNGLYSYDNLLTMFPQLASINQTVLLLILAGTLIFILIVFKLLSIYESDSPSPPPSNHATMASANGSSVSANSISQHGTANTQQFAQPSDNSKKEFYSFLKFLLGLIALVLFLAAPIMMMERFNYVDKLSNPLDFDQIISTYISYGLSYFFIIFALIVVIMVLTAAARNFYLRLKVFKQDLSGKKADPMKTGNGEETQTPLGTTYLYSVIIVLAMLFLAWRVGNFTLDNLTNQLLVGDYIALPLVIIIIVVSFFLLVHFVHAILLMLSRIKTSDIIEFLKKNERKSKVVVRIVKIIQYVIDIILDTFISTLEFIKFVPRFFGYMRNMVFLEDGDALDDDGNDANDKNNT